MIRVILDTKGKVFGKLNILDLFIIFIVVVAVVGVSYKFTQSKSVVLGKADPIQIAFWVEEAPDFAAKAIRKNDLVGDYQMGSTFGRVSKVTLGDSVFFGQNSLGEMVKSSREGYLSILIQVDGEGFLSQEGGVTINNVDYFIGHTTILRVGNAKVMGRVYDLNKREP